MSRRKKCTVKNVVVSPFLVDGERPFVFSAGAKILVNIVRTFADGREETACLVDGKLRIVGKGNKEAFIPVGERLKNELKKVKLSEGMFTGKRFRTSERCMMHLRRAVEKAGLDPTDATNHRFRHSFASNLLRSGKVNIRALGELLRHSDVRVSLDTYSHLLQEDLQKSVDVL